MITHIKQPVENKTLCGLKVKRNLTADRERVLEHADWSVDTEETCVECESKLQMFGLMNRG